MKERSSAIPVRAGDGCDTHTDQSDALSHPVLALISGMVTAGVRASDIIVYDATFGGEATVPEVSFD